MYSLEISDFDPFAKYRLYHPDTGYGFSFVPAKGATVLDLFFDGFNVLDGCQTPEELDHNPAGNSALLFPFPNRLDHGHYHWEGKDYRFPINDPPTDNAIHGFVRDSVFEIDRIVLAKDYASAVCSLHYSGQLEYYPFPFQLNVEYTLFDHGVFRLQVECRNLHLYSIPVGFGWHPYFRLADSAEDHLLLMPACNRVEINERMIPNGNYSALQGWENPTSLRGIQFDTCFLMTGATGDRWSAKLTAGDRTLSLRAATADLPYLMVFTPSHRQSVALEPMSCEMNAFNNRNGLVSLPRDGVWRAAMDLHVTSAKRV